MSTSAELTITLMLDAEARDGCSLKIPYHVSQSSTTSAGADFPRSVSVNLAGLNITISPIGNFILGDVSESSDSRERIGVVGIVAGIPDKPRSSNDTAEFIGREIDSGSMAGSSFVNSVFDETILPTAIGDTDDLGFSDMTTNDFASDLSPISMETRSSQQEPSSVETDVEQDISADAVDRQLNHQIQNRELLLRTLRYFVVIVGCRPGIYINGEDYIEQIYRVPGGKGKSFRSLSDAKQWYKLHLDNESVLIREKKLPRQNKKL